MELLAVLGIVGLLALAISGFAGEAFRLYHANWRAATIQSELGFALTHMSERLREGSSVTIAPGGQGVSFQAWDVNTGALGTFSFTLAGETMQTETGFVLSRYVQATSFSLDPARRTVTISLTSVGPSGPFEAGAGLPITLTNRIALRQPATQAVGSGTVTRLWTFDGDAAGWSAFTRPPALAEVAATYGFPPGSLQGRVSGRNQGREDNVTWEWTGSLAALGVPAGTRVVGAQLTVWWRVAEWQAGEEASWRAVLLAPAGPVTLIPERSGHAAGGWVEASFPQQGLVVDASAIVRLQIIASLETGNADPAVVTLRWDTISLRLVHAPH